jgi:hypothetical protein
VNNPVDGINLPSQGRTTLQTNAREPIVLSGRRETNVRDALTRGVAEYIEQLEFEAIGGRKVRFKKTMEQWAEPEELAKYPACALYTKGAATYDSSRFTPNLGVAVPGFGFVSSSCDFVQDIAVELWATDIPERSALVMMLEDAFNPVSWMYGFRLNLPHYYNQRAVFTMKDCAYDDNEENAMRRYRKATFTLGAVVPLTKMVSAPLAKPRFTLAAIDTDVDVVVNLTTS